MANFKYLRLAEWLRKNINDGTFPPGSKLPTEAELCNQFSISRHTVRQAIATLTAEDLLRGTQGSGTYVSSEFKIAPPITPDSSGSSNTIGLILMDNQSYIFPDIVRGVSNYLASRGYLLNMVFTDANYETERNALELFLNNPPAGLLFEPANSGLPSINYPLYEKVTREIPSILLHTRKSPLCQNLPLRDREGSRMLTDYLIGLGHTRIGTIFTFDECTGQERYLGFLDSTRAHDLVPAKDANIWTAHHRRDDLFEPMGCLALDRMLKNVSAVVCHDDRVAYTLITYLKRRGIRVPEDISVVGYDDSFYATLEFPLTTIAHPKVSYGENAAKALLNLIKSPLEVDVSSYAIPPKLIARSSTAPPSSGD